MLIRSQDKKALCLLSNIEIVEKYKNIKSGKRETIGYTIYNLGGNDIETVLADYSTEEKAIKVLDMIESAYYNLECSKFLGRENDRFASCVFQMPKDEEVSNYK